MELLIGCVAGALQETEYRTLLAQAGFEAIDIEPTREHKFGFISAFIRAQKPKCGDGRDVETGFSPSRAG
jgi:hypothetical protein